MPRTSKRPPRHTRLRIALRLSGVGVAVVLAIGWAMGVRLSKRSPDWWRQVDQDSPRTQRAAELFENTLSEQITRVRPKAAEPPEPIPAPPSPGSPETGESAFAAAEPAPADEPAATPGFVSEPWNVALGVEPTNAWLNTKMKEWAVEWSDEDSFDEWPKEIEEVQVAFRDGLMDVGIRYQYSRRDPSKTRVLTVGVRPKVDEYGQLWFEAETVGFGQLQLPASVFLNDEQTSRLPRHVRDLPEAQRLLRTLVGDRPAARNPVVNLPDGRRVRLLDVQVRDGNLELTCRTEAETPARAARK